MCYDAAPILHRDRDAFAEVLGSGAVGTLPISAEFKTDSDFGGETCDRPRPLCSQALRARYPGRVRKESGKSTPGQGPKTADRESQKSPKRVRMSGFNSFGSFWGLVPGTLSGLFSDSSCVPGPKGPGDPVWGGADRKAKRMILIIMVATTVVPSSMA